MAYPKSLELNGSSSCNYIVPQLLRCVFEIFVTCKIKNFATSFDINGLFRLLQEFSYLWLCLFGTDCF